MTSIDLRKAGLKVTLPRVKILELLAAAEKRHLTAEEVFQHLKQQGEDIGLATVYRVLTQFEAAGLVNRLFFESEQAVFELNDGDSHDHLVCVICGYVEEFKDEIIESRQQAIAQRSEFQITERDLTIYGICPVCQKA